VQSEVGVSSLPPLSERIGPKNKNATDYTDLKTPDVAEIIQK
jgi:hypothetical protein